ncbi:TPA: hypothetical protein MIM75_21525, partial [Klebsiella variicola]|nr:hypothetical protein [Klebsiella variicola]HBX9972463.1 hypothetical protein [Klebsiella variicola]
MTSSYCCVVVAAANVGFVTLTLAVCRPGTFVCFCQLVCQFCQTDVKNASAEALRTCADFFAGWRLSPYRAYSPYRSKSSLALG